MPTLTDNELKKILVSNNDMNKISSELYALIKEGISKLGLDISEDIDIRFSDEYNHLKLDQKHTLIKSFSDGMFDDNKRTAIFSVESTDPDIVTRENIGSLSLYAEIKNIESILKSPYVDTLFYKNNKETPLHRLALKGCLEILSHNSVDKVKNAQDRTPLHVLADTTFWNRRGKLSPDFIPMSWMKEKYPHFNFGKKRTVTLKLVEEVLSQTNAEKFILSLE